MPEGTLTCSTRKRECDGEVLFRKLLVWKDPIARSGPENMAVDEFLMEASDGIPVLRLYEWSGDWISLGYFQSLAAAGEAFGDTVNYVRRWSGGGVVDHREDSTYSLVVPRSESISGLGAAERYREIHRRLAACLIASGQECSLVDCEESRESVLCFQKPVRWDLVSHREKIAGAGQRRTRQGVLHQGSVSVPSGKLARFGDFLSDECVEWAPDLKESLSTRYESEEWLGRVL